MFTACGVITITTDFGHQGPFVATMKGRILTHLPSARIIDVTHEVPVYWPAEAGFWLARAYSYFPERLRARRRRRSGRRNCARHHRRGRRRVMRSSRRTTVCWRPSSRAATRLRIYRLDTREGDCALQAAGAERDVPRSGHLRADRRGTGGRPRHTCGPGSEDSRTSCRPGSTSRQRRADQVAGVIITIDHFGNLITNIDAELIRALPGPGRAYRRPHPPAAADLRRRPARRISRPGEFLRRHRDRPGGAERRRGARPGAGRPGDDFQPLTARLSPRDIPL